MCSFSHSSPIVGMRGVQQVGIEGNGWRVVYQMCVLLRLFWPLKRRADDGDVGVFSPVVMSTCNGRVVSGGGVGKYLVVQVDLWDGMALSVDWRPNCWFTDLRSRATNLGLCAQFVSMTIVNGALGCRSDEPLVDG